MKILRIDSSVRIQNSKTRMLTDYFLEELKTNKEYFLKNRDVGINHQNFQRMNLSKQIIHLYLTEHTK